MTSSALIKLAEAALLLQANGPRHHYLLSERFKYGAAHSSSDVLGEQQGRE